MKSWQHLDSKPRCIQEFPPQARNTHTHTHIHTHKLGCQQVMLRGHSGRVQADLRNTPCLHTFSLTVSLNGPDNPRGDQLIALKFHCGKQYHKYHVQFCQQSQRVEDAGQQLCQVVRLEISETNKERNRKVFRIDSISRPIAHRH